jgi:uncharacterized protein (TIGR04255 family)
LAADYPGYIAVRDKFVASFKKLMDWSDDKNFGVENLVQAELLYTDAIPMEKDGPRISEIFSAFRPQAKRPIGNFNMSWREVFEEFSGYVDTTLGIGAVQDGTAAAILQSNARFDVQGLDLETALSRFDIVHDKISQIFRENVAEQFRGQPS